MEDTIQQWLTRSGIDAGWVPTIAYIVSAVFVSLLCLVSFYIAKKIVIRMLFRSIRSDRFRWGRVLLENKVFQRLVHIVPAVILHFFAPTFGPFQDILEKGIGLYIIVIGMMVLDSLLDSADAIYRTHEVSKVRPIKGYLQVAKIAVYCVGGIVMIANLMGEKPLVLLSGIGAFAAIFSLVFKDSILGLVAGIQLSANDMVRIGDWIEMPKYDADGDVIDISLNTVKVRNFDHSITTIPAYTLISDSFKNWRGMESSGGRRIMRSVNIDIGSIGFCSDALLEKLKGTETLHGYIESKQREIDRYNRENHIDPGSANARRLTNVGVFRVYIQSYLKNLSSVHQNMTRMVRQLPPTEHGLPLQIYVFTNTTDWEAYERIQADIFDHILSVAPQFELRIFQEPTGNDFGGRKPLSF